MPKFIAGSLMHLLVVLLRMAAFFEPRWAFLGLTFDALVSLRDVQEYDKQSSHLWADVRATWPGCRLFDEESNDGKDIPMHEASGTLFNKLTSKSRLTDTTLAAATTPSR